MASAGPNGPGTVASEALAGSTLGSWSTINNVLVNDNNVAYEGDGVTATDEWPNYIKVTNFGFSIPTGATIDGVVVGIRKRRNGTSGTNSFVDKSIRLVKGGTVTGNDNADTSTQYPTTFPIPNTDCGGATDLWGLSLSPSDINSSDFGVVFAPQLSKTSTTPRVEAAYIQITVYYTESSTFIPQIISY